MPKAVKSVACLGQAATWLFFALNDGSYAVLGGLPSSFPPEPIYANCTLFIVMTIVSIMGWQESGSVMPRWDAMMPKGRPKNALLAGMANLGFFAIGKLPSLPASFTCPLCLHACHVAGCTFFTAPFLEMFLPGVIDTLPGAVGTKRAPVGPLDGPIPPIMLIIGNAGKAMICAILTSLAMCSVGDEDTSYRVMRAYVIQGTFYLGTFARDGVLATATGWPQPMRTMTFVQCFGVLFFMIDTMTGIPIKLQPAKK